MTSVAIWLHCGVMHSLTHLLLAAILLGSVARAQEIHFKPSDHALGDVHPFFHQGECFLYYLKPGRYDSTLVRSRDWLHWSDATITHDAAMPEDWMSPYFVLGVFHDPSANVFRSFYGHAHGRMASSLSSDLLHWSCAPKEFHVPAADYYQRRRDPFVFWIPDLKQYGCVMTTWIKGRPKETCGAVSLATSPDLKRWKDHGPILDPGTIGEPECPQMFQLGRRWYLLASIHDRAVGQPVYWDSESPLGPWKKMRTGVVDGKDLCAAQIAFDGDTPILFGWIPLMPAQPGKQHWGGHLALPREVYALPDGKLGTRLPAKLTQTFERLPWQAIDDFTVSTRAHPIEGEWKRIAAEFTLSIPDDVGKVRMSIAPLGTVVVSRDQLRILDGSGECWSELPVDLSSPQKFSFSVFIEDNIVELFVHDRYSLAARLPSREGPMQLSFHCDDAAAHVTAMRVSEWTAR